jgi:protein-disulfide isomerase
MGPIARRTILVSTAALALGLTACKGSGKPAGDFSADMSLGPADAKVTVIEYASPTCPHCAHWNENVFGPFKAKYIDTGKVRYVLREAIIHGPPDAAIFLLARCAGKDKYFSVVDGAWRTLGELNQTQDVRGWVMRLGQSMGMSEADINKCITDQKALDALNARYTKEMKEFDVQYTPTFIINGKKVETPAPPTLEELSAIIDPLLAKPKKT